MSNRNAYFVLRLYGGAHGFYGNLKKLCNDEDLDYRKLQAHFLERNYFYKEGDVKIWKGTIKRGTRNDNK